MSAIINSRERSEMADSQFGRPQWPKIFSSIADKHPGTTVGTFFCGVRSFGTAHFQTKLMKALFTHVQPKVLGSTLHEECNNHTDGHENGTAFVWGKVCTVKRVMPYFLT